LLLKLLAAEGLAAASVVDAVPDAVAAGKTSAFGSARGSSRLAERQTFLS